MAETEGESSGGDNVVFETQLPIDHLVYVVPDLQRGPMFLSSLLSSSSTSSSSSEKEKLEVQPVFGGKHRGRGTQNSLISLGAQTYFEFISLNPEENSLFEPSSSSSPAPHRMFGLTSDNSRLPWIRAWMIRILGDVKLHGEMVRKALQETGLEFKVSQGSRELPSAKTEEQEGKGEGETGGGSVYWSLFVPTTYSNPEPFIPIGISWSQTPPEKHPSQTSPQPSGGLSLSSITLSTKHPELVTQALKAISTALSLAHLSSSPPSSSCSVRNTPIFVRDVRKTSLLPEIVVRFSNGVELGGPWRSVDFQETHSSLLSSSAIPSLSPQYSEVFTLVARIPASLVQTSETILGFSRLSSSSLGPEVLHLELFVISEYRRLGIGRALLTKTLEMIRTRRKQEKKETRLMAKITEVSEEERKVASKLLTSFGFTTSESAFSLNL